MLGRAASVRTSAAPIVLCRRLCFSNRCALSRAGASRLGARAAKAAARLRRASLVYLANADPRCTCGAARRPGRTGPQRLLSVALGLPKPPERPSGSHRLEVRCAKAWAEAGVGARVSIGVMDQRDVSRKQPSPRKLLPSEKLEAVGWAGAVWGALASRALPKANAGAPTRPGGAQRRTCGAGQHLRGRRGKPRVAGPQPSRPTQPQPIPRPAQSTIQPPVKRKARNHPAPDPVHSLELSPAPFVNA